MGFQDLENAKDFYKIVFSIYKTRYPDLTSGAFAIICITIFTVFLIICVIII